MSRGRPPTDANRLDRLQHRRENCDYRAHRPTPERVRSAIEEAETIVGRVEEQIR